jgi:hypothetical protein
MEPVVQSAREIRPALVNTSAGPRAGAGKGACAYGYRLAKVDGFQVVNRMPNSRFDREFCG